MKFIRTFNDRHNVDSVSYADISEYIREEIQLGGVKPFNIEHSLYKSGDYICSSFKINDRDVVVSSIVIDDSETHCVGCGRNYKTLSDCINQYGINSNKYLVIGFGEYSEGVYNDDKNVNDNSTLFRKMATIVEIIKSMVSYHNLNYIIFNSVENDTTSGLNVDYKKRDKFYELFLSYHNIENYKIKSKIDIGGEILSDFYFLNNR